MSLNEDEIQARIEAALYASGRPLSPEELARAAGITSIRKAVICSRSLMRKVNSSLKAVEIIELADRKFVMQLRQSYNKVAKKFAMRPLLSDSALKTLSYIVYFQPITALELASRRGSQVYAHLRQLEQLGFITGEASGRTKSCRTTAAFSEYFGLSPDLQIMKQQLAKLGIQNSRIQKTSRRHIHQEKEDSSPHSRNGQGLLRPSHR